MRIGIDVSLASGEKVGVGYYVSNLLEALAKIDQKNDYVLYPFFGNFFPDALKGVNCQQPENFRLYLNSAPRPLLRAMRFVLGKDNRRYFKGVDLLHCTSFFVPKSFNGKTVSTIYDLSFVLFPECHTEANRLHCLEGTRESVSRCQKLIAISENTKRDLMQYFDVAEDKVVVTYLAPREIFKPVVDVKIKERVLAKYGIASEYIFSLGSIEPRKNFKRLMQAYALLDQDAREAYSLVIAGGGGWLNKDIYAELGALKLEHTVKSIGYVADEDLPTLYSAATLFVYPSLYEGFGMPVVEAMACGTPVVTSNSSSLREIAEGASIMVDAQSVESISHALGDMLSNPEKRESFSGKGLERARKFSWLKTARKTLKLYESLIC